MRKIFYDLFPDKVGRGIVIGLLILMSWMALEPLMFYLPRITHLREDSFLPAILTILYSIPPILLGMFILIGSLELIARLCSFLYHLVKS